MAGAGNGRTLGIAVNRTGAVLATRVRAARSFVSRMVGLLGRAHLEPGEGLIIPGCRSIHTCGMRFPIDAVFVDRSWRVVALRGRLSPWRITPMIWSARTVIELPPGVIHEAHLELGDQLVVQPT